MRSVLSAGVIAFADLFDDALALRSQVEQGSQLAVPMHLLSELRSLFDIINEGSWTSEKRITLHVQATREAYQVKEI